MQEQLPHVKLADEVLENVYSFIYLGSKVAGDGDPIIPVKHRIEVAWGCYGNYRTLFKNTKLSTNLRLRLYAAIVGSTMLHGSSAWLTTKKVTKIINGVNSKMISQITKQSIHQEAKHPSFDLVALLMKRRWSWSYLGHILRMDNTRTVRRFLLELSPARKPLYEGSLPEHIPFETVDEAVMFANDRKQWNDILRF